MTQPFNTMNEGDYITLVSLEKHNLQDAVAFQYKFKFEGIPSEFILGLANKLDTVIVDRMSFNNYTFITLKNSKGRMIGVRLYFNQEEIKKNDFLIYCMVYCHSCIQREVYENFESIIFVEDENIPNITWITAGPRGINTHELKASKHKVPKDIFYPSIDGGVKDYLKKFDESEAPILIILGPPGTAKTSLIKHYIYTYNKKSLVSYDNNLLGSDEFFLYFLNTHHDLLVMEDFDIFLQAREDTDNFIMSKFLNLSQGIVGISDKKMIFTANIEKNKIDSALMRPGRCFDILEFDYYNEKQAQAIIDDGDLTFDGDLSKVSLAELLENKKSDKRQKVGFY